MMVANARVGGSENVIPGYPSKRIFLDPRPGYSDNLRITMEPEEARLIAKKLNRYANFMAPKRKRKST